VRGFATHTIKKAADVMGIEVRRRQEEKPWDRSFRRWIADAEARGEDPNDLGDVDWAGDPKLILETHTDGLYDTGSVVLELGPGTGRATRHVLPRCRKMILLDYSKFVCEWLGGYLAGKGEFEIHWLEHPSFSAVPDCCVDFSFAYGVFEHVELDDSWELLREMFRVLKPDGNVWFNFDTLATPGGLAHFKRERERLGPEQRSVFRFHHPDDIRRLAQDVGFELSRLEQGEHRSAWMTLRKP
jgi:SAM-dependent methyltransferase